MARRKIEVFSLSFLDVIACGFGAIVLFYTILSAQAGVQRQDRNDDIQAEVNRLEEEVLEGYKNLVVLRNSLDTTEQDTPAEGLAARIIEETERLKLQLADADKETLSRREAIERLKQDLKSLEESNRRLSAGTPSPGQPGNRIKGFIGSGDRQYLTGLKVGGARVLILIDASASMLDETVVNIIRLRNMPDERKLGSQKWQQAINTVEWIAARLPEATQFQMYAFDTNARPLVEGSDGRWLSARDAAQIEAALRALRKTAPVGGTSLHNAFTVIGRLTPAPDNVILITDGLPTQGDRPPLIRKLVTMEEREDLMQAAVRSLPPAPPPVSIVLLPMEGDPAAPLYFWRLARSTGGGFLSPAKDWP